MSALFESIQLRDLSLDNRVIVSPMCQYSAKQGNAQSWHHVHFGQYAMAAAGMFITEATAVEEVGRITPACLGLYSDDNENALAGALQVMRGVNPDVHVPVCIQLAHAGRKASSQVPWEGGQQIPIDQGGWQAIAPSPIPHLVDEQPPLELEQTGIDSIKNAFVAAAKRSLKLGIDAIEMHAAHGYLLHQFLSPVSNSRQDSYGGALENRMRLPLEVLQALRQAWPDNKPLGVRISASDWDSKSSWDIDEAVVFCRECEKLGADWIDVSSGGVSSEQQIKLGPCYQLQFAEAIKQAVTIPVMAVGLITEASQAEQIVLQGKADMVALARAFQYNPHWVWHAAAELDGKVSVPPQYWRSEPHSVKGLYKNTVIGQR